MRLGPNLESAFNLDCPFTSLGASVNEVPLWLLNSKEMQFNSLQTSSILSLIQITGDAEMINSQSLYSISLKAGGADKHINRNFKQCGFQLEYMNLRV